MSVRRAAVRPIRLVGILLAPALRPLAAMVAWVGIALSLTVICAGFFVCGPRDPNRVRHVVCILQVEKLMAVAERFRADHGEYPGDGWGMPKDPWGERYVYRRHPGASTPEIVSWGADRKPGGEFFEADVTSRRLSREIPRSPSETRARRILLGSWGGSWLVLAGSIYSLRRLSRRPRSL